MGHSRISRSRVEKPGDRQSRVVVFDLDGTLLDSDEALAQPFIDLGVPRDEITFGPLLERECARLGIEVDDYLLRYDTSSAQPYDGVCEMLASLDSWAICSNKHCSSGRAELARLGWKPDVATFSADYEGGTKLLRPVLDALGVTGTQLLFVGDTVHDLRCARDVGAEFGFAGWNPRVASSDLGDARVFPAPGSILELIS